MVISRGGAGCGEALKTTGMGGGGGTDSFRKSARLLTLITYGAFETTELFLHNITLHCGRFAHLKTDDNSKHT